MLPQVERLRAAHDKASAHLAGAMARVVEAEADQPLLPPASLQAVGVAVPRVLVRGAAAEGGTLLMPTQQGGGDAGAAGGGGGGEGLGLVAVPAVEERREMYKREQAETGG